MDLKEPLSIEKQLQRLESHNMIIANKDRAEDFLSKVTYYRFTGYALQYRLAPHNSNFIDNVSFEHIANIYMFDEELRSLLRKYIEVIEVYFRTKISYYFSMAKCSTPPHDQHYSVKSYFNQTEAQAIIDKFTPSKQHYKDTLVVQHHQAKYGNKFPLWVIMEMLSFSDLSKLYSCMWNSEQDMIASAVGTGKKTLKNHLHCLSVLRNKCAHAARIYNIDFKPSAKLSSNFLRKNPNVKVDSLFAYIAVLVSRLPDEQIKDSFISDLVAVVNKYRLDIDFSLIGFPENFESLLKNR